MGNKIINSKVSAILLGLVYFLLVISLGSIDSFWSFFGRVIGTLIPILPLVLVATKKHKVSRSGKFTLWFIFAISAQILSSLGLSLINLVVLLISLAILIFQMISGLFKKRE